MMNKTLDEKATQKARMAMARAAGMDPRFIDVKVCEAGIRTYLEVTQARESEAVAEIIQDHVYGLKIVMFAGLNGITKFPIGTKLYTAPPSFTALQEDNERLREALEAIMSDAFTGPHSVDIWDKAVAALAGQEKQG